MIVAVGHADLTPETLELVEDELRAVVERLPARASGLVRAGAGAPVAFGRAVRAAGRELVVVTPSQALVPALLPGRDRVAAAELLSYARQVRLLAYDPADRNACVGADERVIAQCRQLLAVWDGSPSNGRDATAHLVAYARAHGVQVEVVWPERAGRADISGAREPDGRCGPRGSGHSPITVGSRPIPNSSEARQPR